jgi:Domain of unknown function (DUF5615)
MPLAFYMDHHVPRAITLGLRLRGVNVLTAYEDGTSELDDVALLDRASELGRVLFTRDDDLLVEAAKRQREGSRSTALSTRINFGFRLGDACRTWKSLLRLENPQSY